jgi:predicted RNase H-like nuclease
MDESVAGVDWYKKGWVCVLLDPENPPEVRVATDLAALIESMPDTACLAIDMPIGLPESTRQADALARHYVGPRRNSVFPTPPAQILEAATYAEANEIAPTLTGGNKISQQAWALRHNIRTVASVADHDARIIEVHPEVSFRCLAGAPVEHPKTSWNGQHDRRRWLTEHGIDLPDRLSHAGAVPVADVLDAAVAAWSARRYAVGDAKALPADAQPGDRQVIWY